MPLIFGFSPPSLGVPPSNPGSAPAQFPTGQTTVYITSHTQTTFSFAPCPSTLSECTVSTIQPHDI